MTTEERRRAPRLRRGRHGADRVPMAGNLNSMFPYIMKRRCDSVAYYPMSIDVENLLAYIEANKSTEMAMTFFQAVLLALAKILRERPALNRYIIGRRVYQRHNVELAFLARREYSENSTETNVWVSIEPGDRRAEILRKITGNIQIAKSGSDKDDEKAIGAFLRLPRWALRLAIRFLEWYDFYFDTPKPFRGGVDPLRCSAYIANVGSVGLGAPYHHLFEWGTCSLFVSIGKIEPRVCVGADGKPTVRRMVDLRFALDERIADGFYDARSLELFAEYLLDPRQLETL